MDERLKTALVRDARVIVERDGINGLVDYQHHAYLCGCLGPLKGDPLCPCRMSHALEINLLEVVNEIDPQAALTLMRRRIIAALR